MGRSDALHRGVLNSLRIRSLLTALQVLVLVVTRPSTLWGDEGMKAMPMIAYHLTGKRWAQVRSSGHSLHGLRLRLELGIWAFDQKSRCLILSWIQKRFERLAIHLTCSGWSVEDLHRDVCGLRTSFLS